MRHGVDRPTPTDSQRERLETYLDELERWNRRLNLTRVTRADAVERHVGDTLDLLHAAGPAPGARCIDVGTGGGIPGIPLAILRPDLRVTLLDSDRRKCGFLVFVTGLLGLTHVDIVTERAEVAAHSVEHRERYDVAMSRATAALPVLCELTLPFVSVGGQLLALVRDAQASALSAGPSAQACGGGSPDARGVGVVVVDKVRPTPAEFPRRAGLPQRRPL